LPFPAHPRVAFRLRQGFGGTSQAEKSGSGCRHTFRPSGNPAGWNRKRSVPLALLLVNPGVVGGANAAAQRYAARKNGLPLVGLSRGTPRSPEMVGAWKTKLCWA